MATEGVRPVSVNGKEDSFRSTGRGHLPRCLGQPAEPLKEGQFGKHIFGVNLQRNAFRSKEIKFWRIEWFLVFLSYFDTDFIALEVYPCWAALMIRAGVSGH